MNIGDIIRIKGRWGFNIDPEFKVIAMNSSLVTLEAHPKRDGGLLSHMNTEMVGFEVLEGRYVVINNQYRHDTRN